jgi:hypothetical protein
MKPNSTSRWGSRFIIFIFSHTPWPSTINFSFLLPPTYCFTVPSSLSRPFLAHNFFSLFLWDLLHYFFLWFSFTCLYFFLIFYFVDLSSRPLWFRYFFLVTCRVCPKILTLFSLPHGSHVSHISQKKVKDMVPQRVSRNAKHEGDGKLRKDDERDL